jgi:hypothetical protein
MKTLFNEVCNVFSHKCRLSIQEMFEEHVETFGGQSHGFLCGLEIEQST